MASLAVLVVYPSWWIFSSFMAGVAALALLLWHTFLRSTGDGSFAEDDNESESEALATFEDAIKAVERHTEVVVLGWNACHDLQVMQLSQEVSHTVGSDYLIVAGSEAPPEEWWPSEEEEAWRTQWRTPPPHAGQWRGECRRCFFSRLRSAAKSGPLLRNERPCVQVAWSCPSCWLSWWLTGPSYQARRPLPPRSGHPRSSRDHRTVRRPPRGLKEVVLSGRQEIEMEVEVLDGATASLGFFVVVGILIFICLQGEVNQGAIGNPTAAY
eukprot:g12201.t1